MKPSEKAKAAGLKNLKEMVAITGVQRETLHLWNKNNPRKFNVFLMGAVAIKAARLLEDE
jgi:hypothetical protein